MLRDTARASVQDAPVHIPDDAAYFKRGNSFYVEAWVRVDGVIADDVLNEDPEEVERGALLN